jgi:hypothetical protein
MRQVLAEARRLAGQVPRRFGIADWAYLNFDPPRWLDETKDYSRAATPGRDAYLTYEAQRDLRRHGKVLWGAVLQASLHVFEPGPFDGAAMVAYSHDAFFEEDLAGLRDVAEALFRLKGTRVEDRRLGALVNAMSGENAPLCHVIVPPDLTGGRLVAVTYLHLPRQYLPDGYLAANQLPVLIDEERSPGSIPLPWKYWPDDFVTRWASGEVLPGAGSAAPDGREVSS